MTGKELADVQPLEVTPMLQPGLAEIAAQPEPPQTESGSTEVPAAETAAPPS